MTVSFLDKIKNKWHEGKFVCVGLDKGNFEFDKSIIDQTFDLVCAYKLQSAFYEASVVEGWKDLKESVTYIKNNHPDLPVILDAKRGDIGHSNEAYAQAILDHLGFDAVTLHPYLGQESLQPFLDRKDKGIFILVKTSNPGSGEFQDLQVEGTPLYQVVAEHINIWNKNGNLAVVVGATYPKELKIVRQIIGDMPILVPGIGAQEGDLKATLLVGLDSKKQGLIINSSRSIIFAPNPREATLKLHEEIKKYV